jgi:hypothetical protein
LAVFDFVFDTDTLVGIFMQGFSSGIMGIVSAVITLILLKNKEYRSLGHLHKRIWGQVIVPDQNRLAWFSLAALMYPSRILETSVLPT